MFAIGTVKTAGASLIQMSPAGAPANTGAAYTSGLTLSFDG
ncbi:hypothetical protein [Arthrobacter alpinus]|nr:hypothetical protein [Arthrobacter alpinus]